MFSRWWIIHKFPNNTLVVATVTRRSEVKRAGYGCRYLSGNFEKRDRKPGALTPG